MGKVPAFALDPLFLFAGVMFLLIGIVITVQITTFFDSESVGMVGNDKLHSYYTNFQDLDWVIPFFVGGAIVAMLLFASLAGAVPISVVLFLIVAIVLDIVIVYVNDFNIMFFDASEIITPLNMPMTRFTLQWLPMILTLTIVLMGTLMHSRSNY
jgi:hypothetical protein